MNLVPSHQLYKIITPRKRQVRNNLYNQKGGRNGLAKEKKQIEKNPKIA